MRSIAMFSILATMLLINQSGQPEFPLGVELNSSTSGNGYNVKVTCKVTKNGNIYTYFYSIKNENNEKTLVTWEAVSRALYYGTDAQTLWELKPNENVLVIIESESPPVYINGILNVYARENRKEFEREFNESGLPNVKIRVSKSSSPVYGQSGGGTTAAIPEAFVRKELRPFEHRE